MGSQPVLLGFLDAAMGEGEGHYTVNKVMQNIKFQTTNSV